MEQDRSLEYDYRQYDRVWQRVAPDLEPYPGLRSRTGEASAGMTAASSGMAAQTAGMTAASSGMTSSAAGMTAASSGMTSSAAGMTAQTAGMTAQTAPAAAQTAPASGGAMARQESQLPGAFPNPCCMGTAAGEMLEVLTGFIEEELADQRYFLALSRQAPSWARQRLREIAQEEGAHAKRLMAVHYLITGSCYQPAVSAGRVLAGRWCPALREQYHAEACSGLNYARAAEGTTDPCLAKLLSQLSAEEYRHAEELMALLERAIQGRG